ncbi:MAG: diguanylate cyclase [Oligoflexia bacterium]|nr:diguanylate cyclase [Oligoflexia bacterium]
MEIAKVRKDFMVFVVDDEESIREVVKETFSQAGYQVEMFPTAEDALKRIQESPPHLIFSDIRMPGMSGIQLLENVRKLSKDIEFIIMTSHASLETAVNAMKLGAYDYIYKPFENLADLVSTADRTVERLYMKLENEQLLEELGEKNKLLNAVNQKISKENKEIQAVNQLMHRLSQKLDPDAVIQALLDSIAEVSGGAPAIMLRYLPAYQSLVVAHGSKIPIEQFRKVGINLSQVDPKTIPPMLTQPMKMQPLTDLMKEVFKIQVHFALPFMNEGQPAGVVVAFNGALGDEGRRLLESFVQITQVSFDNAMMAKRIHEMAIKDPLTSLYNRRFFNEKLGEEIARSRRTHYPLSLIYLDIDHFKKYNDTNGHPMGDVIIKSVAQILQKTSRKTDIVARLGGEEFAILCPHTAAAGAAIKAEKVRLTVESTKFPHGEKQPMGKVTVSLGVSEYPTFVSDDQALVRSADDALYKVKQGGRNRVAMAEAPQGFKPEFEPLPVPAYTGPGNPKASA